MKKSILLALFMWVGLATAPVCAADTNGMPAAPVALRPSVEVRRSVIRLSDVFDGIADTEDRDIALAPEPGKSVTYNAPVLAQLAQQYRLAWKPVSLADQTVLTRAATEISADMVRAKVLEKIQSLDPGVRDASEIVFDNRRVGLSLPADQKPDFALNNFAYNAQTHRFQTEVVAQDENKAPQIQTVTGRLIVRVEVPTLIKRTQAQTVIGPRDMVTVTMDEDHLPKDVLTDSAQIVGKVLRVDAQEGDMLRARDLLPQRLVTRGALVTLKIETPFMQITARGRSLVDGAKGDVVQITNLQSKRLVEGVVESDGTVRVDLANKNNVSLSGNGIQGG